MASEQFEFQAEVKQLLDLMIHSLYSNPDVFLRELVSNASDALDRRRFAGLTNAELLPDEPLGIEIVLDRDARELSLRDNGIGMSRDEIVENLGTIARSGTAEFLAAMQNASEELSPDLIGQFGVGFYASFMVADEVTVVSRKADSDESTRWVSSGGGHFSVEAAERDAVGTTVTLKLKPTESESPRADYTDEWLIRQIVKRYSDFVAYPIGLETRGGDNPKRDPEPLNSMKAIWIRPEAEVGAEEYGEFYKHISHDWNDPLLHLSSRIEGKFEARALLYIPSVAPFDLYHREMAHRGIQLYVRRIFIMDECRDLMPEYLRFVKGVVDAEDLSLNVSREMLQRDVQIETIRNHLVKKVLDALHELRDGDAEKYRDFWRQFGPVVKEGLLDPTEKRERILDITLCATTREGETLTPLGDLVERMPEDQEVIYYLTGPSQEQLESSPHLEVFAERGIEVALFTDHVDEVWLEQGAPEFRGKRFQSALKGELDLGEADTPDADAAQPDAQEPRFRELIAALRAGIQDHVKEVRLSTRLRTSPACLVLDEGDLSPQISELLRRSGQNVPASKPILEINPAHPLLVKLHEVCDADRDDPRLAEYAELLLGQAILAEGGQLPDPSAFGRRIAELMLGAL